MERYVLTKSHKIYHVLRKIFHLSKTFRIFSTEILESSVVYVELNTSSFILFIKLFIFVTIPSFFLITDTEDISRFQT